MVDPDQINAPSRHGPGADRQHRHPDRRGGQTYAALTGKPTTPKIGTTFTIITQANESSPQSQAAIYKTSC